MAEIITTKRDTEINRLLERVIRDHRKDISAYSKGHLNENNLWQPPESKRSAWPTSKLPAIRFKGPIKISDNKRKETMWEAVACFSAGSAFKCDLPSKPDTAVNKETEGKKRDNIHLEEFDASYMILPRGDSHTYQILPSIHGCLTKKEEVEQRRLFESKIIEKHNLTERGWLDGSRVKEGLVKSYSTTSKQASDQVYEGLFEELCARCSTYQPLLSDIRTFYNHYLAKLTQQRGDTVDIPAGSEENAEVAVINKEIRKVQKQVDQLECKAMELLNKKSGLTEELDITTAVLSELQLTYTATSCTTQSVTTLDDNYSNNIGSQIEALRREILQAQSELDAVKSTQRREMVPSEVYHCMIQCVQSSELEIQKQIKTIEMLEQKEEGMQEQLDKLFATMDLTEEQCTQLRALKISLV